MDAESNWFRRLKQFLHIEPSNLEQLIHLLREVQHSALIGEETLAMLEGVILLSQLKVRDIMLPKQQMSCIPVDSQLETAIGIISQSGHSRFPVTGESKDEIIGILHAKDLLRFEADKNLPYALKDIVRQAAYVPESKRLDSLLTEFRSNRNHLAIVVDEYGNVAGLVTLEDILEQIIGEIEDEFDFDEESNIKAHGEHHYIINALTPIEEFNLSLKAQFSDEVFDTIGGIILANFGYLPKRNESILIEQFEFRIINADARRIKLLECFDRRSTEPPASAGNDEQ